MTVKVSIFGSVLDRLHELGCAIPSGILILPDNFENAQQGDEWRFAGEAITALKLLRSAGLPANKLAGSEHVEGYVHNHSADWVLPIIFLGSEFLKQGPDMCHGARLTAIMAGSERAANDLLGLAAIGNSLACELEVYVLLKDGASETAWIRLIDAQDAIVAASRASCSFSNLDAKFERLREMEKWLFPPQSFTSAGMIAGRQDCSICRDDYSKCNHIAGRPYMGRFCNVELKNIRPDHVALVEAPYDRRCRVTSFSVTGGSRNKMTWVFTPDTDADERKEIGRASCRERV